VPGVGDGLLRERALGAFDEQAVQVKGGEDGADVAQVLRPRVAEYQYIVEEDEDEAAQKRTEHVSAWNVAGVLHSPNGMTRNS
jgi:hypothetical protein